MDTIDEYYERKYDYYDIENSRKDIFKLANDYAEYCMHQSKVKNNVVLDGVVKCNCANESTDIYDEYGKLLGWACFHCKIIEQ